jgi:hypothetical protein
LGRAALSVAQAAADNHAESDNSNGRGQAGGDTGMIFHTEEGCKRQSIKSLRVS